MSRRSCFNFRELAAAVRPELAELLGYDRFPDHFDWLDPPEPTTSVKSPSEENSNES